MKKLTMRTPELAGRNFAVLAGLFPNAVTETVDENGAVIRAVDADILAQEINTRVVSGKEERYQFTWPDKKKSVLLANAPITATLRPCRGESVNFDTTENLYIEGDNLDVLKLLRETYLNRVKMIYIDPPYNTGNDFVYADNFAVDADEFLARDGQYDEDGNRMVRNPDSGGRFHTDWLNMIYPRLRVARDLLADDGIIFISIDDHEIAQLLKVCDEIFGVGNFVAIINWKGRGGRQDSKYYAAVHEYVLCYAKSKGGFRAGEEIKSGDVYPKYDTKKKRFYKTQLLRKWGSNSRREDRPNLFYPITAPDGSDVYPMLSGEVGENSSGLSKPEGCWRWSSGTLKTALKDGLIEFVKQNNGSWIPYEKIYAPLEGEEKTKKYTTWIEESNDGASVVKELFGTAVFSYPKTPMLLGKFLRMANVESGDIVLDFFSGSATTAHAVMRLNAEDGGKRKFIMVQLPEITEENSEAFKAGYKNICEIGKERIRRAGQKILEEVRDSNRQSERGAEKKSEPDTGFRVLKLDSSNMKEVYYTPHEYAEPRFDFSSLVDNIKSDRTAEDLLFQVMLDLGIPLSCKIEVKAVEGKTAYYVNDGYLIACFESVNDELVTALSQSKPHYAVFRDRGFAADSTLVNFEQIFKTYSPSTERRIL